MPVQATSQSVKKKEMEDLYNHLKVNIMKKALILISALLAMAACQINELDSGYVQTDENLYASIESIGATKTAMDENYNVLWSENDELIAFMKTTLGVKYQIKEQYVGTSTGGFSKINEPESGDDLEAGQELDHNVVVYPHSYDVWCMKNDRNTPAQSYKLNIVLPETQTYEENSFAIGAFPMVAVSTDNKLTFRNICGGLKLQFKGVDKIKSIKLEGLCNEKISGKASVVGYVDGTPTITMASTATGSVTLDCGEGVQLSQDSPVTFIIAVPPIEFASGMMITVTDTDGLSKTLTNSSSNTIKRSSLLSFPVITYQQEGVFELPEGTLTSYEILAEGGTVEIPLVTNQEYEVVIPVDAQKWISVVETKALRNETVVLNISENTTTEARSAEILITSTEETTLQTISVSQEAGKVAPGLIDYIDEYNVNHGKGIVVEDVIWAPVNCGYHPIDYKYGKLYQWGRKYGQGYSGEFYDITNSAAGTTSDATIPIISTGGVNTIVGNAPENKDIFYHGIEGNQSFCWDWTNTPDPQLWNNGSELFPAKTTYDPCPEGWRVPTHSEFETLKFKAISDEEEENGVIGVWYNSNNEVSENIFFPLAGYITYDGYCTWRGRFGGYWSSCGVNDYSYVHTLTIDSGPIINFGYRTTARAEGYSIRCVQDMNISEPEPEPNTTNYIDEYGIDHGTGIQIINTVWAPVNCGYHATDFKYGKIYQWGRKYGQGYDAGDASVPELVVGPVSLTTGQIESNMDHFYYNSSNWLDYQDDGLWNAGNETEPIKTEYDPCPNGWRIPTYDELYELTKVTSSWTTDDTGIKGTLFTYSSSYSNVPLQIFLPAAGYRSQDKGQTYNRDIIGCYWSSSPKGTLARYLSIINGMELISSDKRANGYSVRCVKE